MKIFEVLQFKREYSVLKCKIQTNRSNLQKKKFKTSVQKLENKFNVFKQNLPNTIQIELNLVYALRICLMVIFYVPSVSRVYKKMIL